MVLDSNTAGAVNLFDRNTSTAYVSSGYAGSTFTTITWTASSAVAISRIALQNCNFGQFEIYYNGTTTNVFTPTLSANSATADDMYFEFATVTVSSISIKVTNTYPLNTEKSVGEVYVGDELLEFPFNPAAENYSPIVYRKGQDMEMADGGMVSVFLEEKFRADISMEFIDPTNTALFRGIWNRHEPIFFVPFPNINEYKAGTSTTWDGSAFECAWIGNFDALKISNNILANGYNISISLQETPT